MKTIPDGRLSRLLKAVCDDTFAARIEVLEEAGRGGMGIVYRAKSLEDGSTIAIKELSGADDIDIERFVKEAEALEQLDHPGIVRYREHGAMRGGKHYLAIDWLDGASLRDHLRDGELDMRRSLAITRQVAEALAHAHAHGIVHRDVKPGNLMLLDDPEGRVVLVDFGIARRVEAEHETITRSDQIVGTPGYLAPEQLVAGGVIEGKTDVFALGCVLYEMLTGERPFHGDGIVQLLVDVVSREPTPVAELRDDTPHRLATLTTAMLAKRTAERPIAAAVAAELALIEEALDTGDTRSLATRSPLAAVTMDANASGSSPSSRRLLLFGAAAAGIAIAVAIATSSDPKVPAASTATPTPATSASAAPSVDTLPRCDRDMRAGCLERCVRNDFEACLRQGEALVHGTHAFERDRPEGLALLRKACDGGVGRACLTASTILKLESKDIPAEEWSRDYQALLERGCDLGHGNACRRHASQLHSGKIVKTDPAAAIQKAERGCDLGDNHACRMVAAWYGAAKKPRAQQSALRRACDRHDKLACASLAKLKPKSPDVVDSPW